MNNKIVVIADDIRSSHNVGSLLRTCEGLGVERVYLTGYTPYPVSDKDDRLPHVAAKINKRIIKTSLGAETTISWEHVANIIELIDNLRKKGYKIVAVELTKTATKLNNFKTPEQVAFIFGNERTGIIADHLKHVDQTVYIPMLGNKESFNVIQSAAMVLYQARFN
ncbi:MAG TPA: TrmH family RNA methyltransferase [Candidatus Dormibacteraeota bacterium]|nr:TrmH family RNA methyltransferase [Candidatus Dormibacteraeota bacterium]